MNLKEQKQNLINIIKGQVKIEGFDISSKELNDIFNGIDLGNLQKYIIAKNLISAYEFIFELKDYPLSIPFITEVHKIIGSNLIYRNGSFRNRDVYITGTNYKPKMVNEYQIREKLEPLIEKKDYIKLVLEMMKTQIFDDGNKRTGIMTLQKTLLEQNKILSLSVNNVDSLISYILKYYETSDMKPFENFVVANTINLQLGSKIEI